MKGLKVLTVAGIFVILTSIICLGDREVVYKKQKIFSSPEEVVEVLNTKTLNGFEEDNKSYSSIVNTDDFKECLSKRKRVTGSLIDFKSLDLQIEKNYNEEEIIDNYKVLTNCFLDYKVQDRIKAYKLKGTYESINEHKGNVTLDLVFVDEGEGYVIDYIMTTYDDEKNRFISE